MPFELLYGQQPQGFLGIPKEAQEEQHSSFWLVIEYVVDVQQKIERVAPSINKHMLTAQRDQQHIYNQPA